MKSIRLVALSVGLNIVLLTALGAIILKQSSYRMYQLDVLLHGTSV